MVIAASVMAVSSHLSVSRFLTTYPIAGRLSQSASGCWDRAGINLIGARAVGSIS